jgi:hypothetical protein
MVGAFIVAIVSSFGKFDRQAKIAKMRDDVRRLAVPNKRVQHSP